MRRLWHIRGAVAGVILGMAAVAPADELPLLDSHLHYSQNSWQDQAPAAILLLMDQGGVRRAFVSSTPDEGTVRLFEMAPDRVVPVLRPYRQAGELSSWHQDPTVVPYLEQLWRLNFLFPLAVAYAMIRYDLFDVRSLIRASTVYAAVTGLVVAAYAGFCATVLVRARRRDRDAAGTDAATDDTLLLAWASQTGFAQQLAEHTAQALRGAGVSVVRDPLELADRLAGASGDWILQEYVAGEEFGVFWARRPDETRGRILSMVLGDVGRILIAGVVVGCLLALAAGRGVRSLLFGLDSSDAVTLAAAVVPLAAAGLLSAAWPALRALRIDPMSVLREN